MMPRFRARPWAFLTGLAAVALLGPPLAVALADLSGSGHRWPDLAAQFSAPATVAALIVTLAFGLLRARGPLLAGVVVTALCLAAATPQAHPDLPAAEPGAATMRLYSANLYVGNDDVAAVAASIREARPDVVVLIEAGDAVGGSLDRLVPDLPHRTASPRRLWRGLGERTVIASRWPLGPLRDERTVQVRTPLGPIDVTATHLTRPWPYQVQWEQIRDVDRLAAGLGDGPRVVAGDFNSVTDARIGRRFAAASGMTPAPAFPGTWPADLPGVFGVGIDNVWVSRELTVTERRLGVRNGSDHRPVVTVLTRARR